MAIDNESVEKGKRYKFLVEYEGEVTSVDDCVHLSWNRGAFGAEMWSIPLQKIVSAEPLPFPASWPPEPGDTWLYRDAENPGDSVAYFCRATRAGRVLIPDTGDSSSLEVSRIEELAKTNPDHPLLKQIAGFRLHSRIRYPVLAAPYPAAA